jgi:UPF0271 protein
MNELTQIEARIDLNADAGEGFDSPELFGSISSANVACGGHAGDEASIRGALELARACGVAVGAHPGYEDRERFGRVETGDPASAVGELVRRQVGRLAEAAASAGVPMAHVKPHGALYHRLTEDSEAALATIAAIAELDPGITIVGFPGSELLLAARAAGLPWIGEGFADRRYGGDGDDARLVPRQHRDALLGEGEAVDQALRLAAGGRVGTICLHSDAAGAATLAVAIRRALESRSIVVRPFVDDSRVVGLPELHVVGAAIVERGRVLLARRGARMSLAGKWEFPGGKVEPGEPPRVALAREVAEELGLAVEVGDRLGRGTAIDSGRRIVLEVFEARQTGGLLRLHEHEEHRWFGAAELASLNWPDADLPILPALSRRLGGAA